MVVAIIIQARMNSARFPGKVLAPLCGIPVLQRVIDAGFRTTYETYTSIPDADDHSPLGAYLMGECRARLMGPCGLDENDVLGRFYHSAVSLGKPDTIVRLTGDCPLVDHRTIIEMVERFQSRRIPYIGRANDPDGNDVEVFSFSVLEQAQRCNSLEKGDREHVTSWIRRLPNAVLMTAPQDTTGIKYSIDTVDDLRVCEALLNECGAGATWQDYCAAYRRLYLAPKPASGLVIVESQKVAMRAATLIPMGTQTSSKAAARMCYGFGPKFAIRANGCEVVDVDGNKFIDWAMGLGPITIGHGDGRIENAVRYAVGFGNCLTLPHDFEVSLAEKLNKWVPCAENVRFMKSGSDATSACVRLARAFTSRYDIVRCGYHGWADWALDPQYGNADGIPPEVSKLTHAVPYGDLEEVEEAFQHYQPACFILEPVSLIKPPDWYLPRVRKLCDTYNVILIFDEIITGIRMAKGGAQEVFGVKPDLCAIGKGLANGIPISAVCGRADIMDMFNHTHISGTFFGDTIGLSAALETMSILEEQNFWAHQERVGKSLIEGYAAARAENGMSSYTRILGMPHFTVVQWDDQAHGTLFQQEMLRRGVLFTGSQFPCLAHHEAAINQTVRAYGEAMRITADAIKTGTVEKKLECKVNKTLFKRHA